MPHELSSFELNDLLLKNVSGETIPAYSICEVDDTEIVDGERPKVIVMKPTGDGVIHVATGLIPIPAGGMGGRIAHVRSFDTRRWVKYSGDAPTFGSEVGPVADSWEVSRQGSGFRVWGVKEAKNLVLIDEAAGGGGGGGGNWIVEIVKVDTECDCLRATCEVIRRAEGDTRWHCGDMITVYDDLRDPDGPGCVLNAVASDLERTEERSGVKAVVCRTVGDCEYGAEMLPEECDPYGEVDLGAAHFSFVRRCCAGDIT